MSFKGLNDSLTRRAVECTGKQPVHQWSSIVLNDSARMTDQKSRCVIYSRRLSRAHTADDWQHI